MTGGGAIVLLAHGAATWFMCGLIWFVQGVHYPLFGAVGRETFSAYHAAHSRLTTYVVAVPMCVELATAVLLLWTRPSGVPAWSAWAGLGLLLAIWVSTGALQVPRHNELGGGFEEIAHRRLVDSNWIRTIAWSARGLLVAWMLYGASGG